jgi:hypothetical protein
MKEEQTFQHRFREYNGAVEEFLLRLGGGVGARLRGGRNEEKKKGASARAMCPLDAAPPRERGVCLRL